MNRTKYYLLNIFIFILVVFVLFLSIYTNYSDKEITNLAYVIAFGIDKGYKKNLKLTMQFSENMNKKNNGDKNNDNKTSQSSSSSIASVECETIDSGINLLNSYISRNINFSHCKIIIISEEIAKNEISEYLLFLCNNPEVSSHANFMISKCKAKAFLENSNPMLESMSARYYEIAPFSYKYTGLTKATTLIEFFSDYIDNTKQSTAILGNINESNIIESNNKVEYIGLAVFKDAKYVGELNGIESICHLIATNKLKNCTFQINNPKYEKSILDINIESCKSKNKVTFINDYPYIELNINVKARISSVDRSIDFTNKDDIKIIEQEISQYITNQMYSYLYKISKQYKADIDGFGKSAIPHFLTLQDWSNYNWLNKYNDSIFKVNVKTTIDSGYKLFNI